MIVVAVMLGILLNNMKNSIEIFWKTLLDLCFCEIMRNSCKVSTVANNL